jgi:hypothetical protein
MRRETGVLVWRVVGVSVIAAEREEQVSYCAPFFLDNHMVTWIKLTVRPTT